ncbi:MAG: ribosome-associated translation inhibitor RaiA [Bacilli bacterium]|nr:ribosome-associated translation inhibitor RaiA [Bacilli bacterium]
MKLNIRGDKVEITEAIKNQVTEKLKKLDNYFENPEEITANVLIRINGTSQKIEVTVPTKRFTLRAEESTEDLYAAINLVIDKLERQIRKNKTRLNRKFKNNIVSEMNMTFEITDEEATEKKIMRRKDFEMKPMDEEEAILQMELLGHDFFIFKNESEECTSVVYKRKNDTYGIINVK